MPVLEPVLELELGPEPVSVAAVLATVSNHKLDKS